MKISPARAAAFDILLRVESDRAFSSVLLPQHESSLSPKDRALCHELVLGTLRRQIYLDRTIDLFSGGKRLDTAVRIALRLGIYQLYFLDKVPAHSAVNDSVELVARAKKRSAKGFANALLRRASTGAPELAYADDLDRISVETSHPRWLLEKWAAQFGPDDAYWIAAANNTVGSHAFRIIGDAGLDEFAAFRRSEFVEGCYIADRLDGRLIELADRGQIYFQDEASQMAASAVDVRAGERFLDACAAPGGKTGLIARRFNTARAIIAGDVYWQRVLLLRDNCRRQRAADVSVVQYDAERALPFEENTLDAVLVDAPCSGTGTIRSNPEIRYFLGPDDFRSLSNKQLAIAKNASKLVRSGGTLVYSTCSLEREENEGLCEQLLQVDSGLEVVIPKVPERFITGDGYARTYPHRDGMDGFFIAAFRRR